MPSTPYKLTQPLKYLIIYLFLAFISACGGGQYVGDNNANSTAINATDVSNKPQFAALAEERDMQPVTFDVVENVAYMNGNMDSTIPLLVKNLIEYHPEVNTIVMQKVLGTIDFQATLKAGRLVREACLKTVVPYAATIASGGVHFFFSGCQRFIESGGRLGIHSWKYTVVDKNGNVSEEWAASDLPSTDPAHTPYLNYQFDMGIPDEFYWKMINTPFDNMRYLRKNEIESFNIITSPTKNWGASYQLAISNSNTQITWEAARFYVSDNTAVLHGKIDRNTRTDLQKMLVDHPEVDTLSLGHVTGTTDADIRNVIKLGETIREYCLTTQVTPTSYVAPEALHIFIAGCQREVKNGGKIAPSSWVNTTPTIDSTFLNYYDQLGIPQAFYHYLISSSKTDASKIDREKFRQLGVI